jgi:hypothetical protein
MSEITLPCEIVDSEKEITFGKYKQIQLERQNEIGRTQFSRLMESCGDSEIIESIFGETAHSYHTGTLPVGLIMKQADNPSWETVLWGQSFAKKDGEFDEDAIRRIVMKYDAEDFDLE